MVPTFLHVEYPSNVQIRDSGLTSRTVALEANATLYCSSSGTSPSYQWYHNGSYIWGATYSWYSVSFANFSDAGQYLCEVSNTVGTGRRTYQLRVQGMYVWSMSCNMILSIAHTLLCLCQELKRLVTI